MVDPVPQAMVLTAIVIGVSIQALALALIIQVYRHYGTLDIRELRHKLELDVARANRLGPAHSADEPETVVATPASGPASAGTLT